MYENNALKNLGMLCPSNTVDQYCPLMRIHFGGLHRVQFGQHSPGTGRHCDRTEGDNEEGSAYVLEGGKKLRARMKQKNDSRPVKQATRPKCHGFQSDFCGRKIKISCSCHSAVSLIRYEMNGTLLLHVTCQSEQNYS